MTINSNRPHNPTYPLIHYRSSSFKSSNFYKHEENWIFITLVVASIFYLVMVMIL
jgi:hypothetical protein